MENLDAPLVENESQPIGVGGRILSGMGQAIKSGVATGFIGAIGGAVFGALGLAGASEAAEASSATDSLDVMTDLPPATETELVAENAETPKVASGLRAPAVAQDPSNPFMDKPIDVLMAEDPAPDTPEPPPASSNTLANAGAGAVAGAAVGATGGVLAGGTKGLLWAEKIKAEREAIEQARAEGQMGGIA